MFEFEDQKCYLYCEQKETSKIAYRQISVWKDDIYNYPIELQGSFSVEELKYITKTAEQYISNGLENFCTKCKGQKWYQYSTHGTPHYKPCETCCNHDQGWWLLTEHHFPIGKYDPNKKICACIKGCGTRKEGDRLYYGD